jgi:BirA family biotin operon repressor/biotin-[acetyl-CoA-carboxylase] ligase
MNWNEVINLHETSSTLTYLNELSKERTLPEGYTVYADYQSEGRGQRGNSWESAKGKNLMFSTILYPKGLKANQQFIISQIVSLAIRDVLSGEAGYITIKWPNDIYWRDKKITGILIENEIMDEKVSRSLLGIGINLNQENFVSDAPNPVSLKQITGRTYDIENMLMKILHRIEYYYISWQSENATDLINSIYQKALYRRGEQHAFEDKEGIFLATIQGVEKSGLLVLRTDNGRIKRYAFKEVKFIL